MDFKYVELGDIPVLMHFFKTQRSRMSDFTIGSFFEWSDYLMTQFAIEDETLFIRFFDRAHDYYIYAYPLFDHVPTDELEELKLIDKAVKRIVAQVAGANPVTLAAVPQNKLDLLAKCFDISYHYERMWSDYLYDAAAFRDFAGKKYHSKRNHISRFLRDYGEFTFLPITSDNIGEALELFDEYQKNGEKNELSDYEFSQSQKALRHFKQLNLTGGMIKVGGKVVGVTVGSVQGDTLYVHIEKALREYNGAFTVLANTFARQFPSVSYINREDDSGDEGLRKSKLSYNPIELIHKYVVYLKN